MVFPLQSALPFGPEAVQGGSEGLHRGPEAGWKEREGLLQASSSLQGTRGKKALTERHRLWSQACGRPFQSMAGRGGGTLSLLLQGSPRSSGLAYRLQNETLYHLHSISPQSGPHSHPLLFPQDYKSSCEDLSCLLQLEPRNGPAQKLQQEVNQSLN